MVTPFSSFQAEAFLRDVMGAQNITERGDQLIHSCVLPFGMHPNGDRNPSAALNKELLLYNCFTCGGGTLLWAVENVLDISAKEARTLLSENLSPLKLTREQGMEELKKIEEHWQIQDQTIPSFTFKIIEPWRGVAKYLLERGITKQVQQEMLTGIQLDNMDEVGKGEDKQLITQPRLVIPHVFRSKLVGWSKRKLDDRKQAGPKYKHTHGFPKSETLYNYDKVRGFDELIVVESPMSVLKLKSEGIDNCVATFGAEVNQRQIELISGFSNVVLFPDGDRAGYRALKNLDRRGNETGLIKSLLPLTNLYVIDHGINTDEDGMYVWNNRDAADYGTEELGVLLSSKVPAGLWTFRGIIDGRG